MFKKFLITITLSLAIIASCLVCPKNISAYAQQGNITYVAFGDSIAEGYAINMKTKTDSEELIGGYRKTYVSVDNCYVDLINKELSKTYNTSTYNYAYSGDTCQDLINYIGEFYDYDNNAVKNGEKVSESYPALTNAQIYNSVKNANIITICIGANNVLGGAFKLMSGFLGLTTPAVTRAEMEAQLKIQILGSEEQNIKGLKAEFAELLNILDRLNPNAYIYFTNVYNPYKVLIGDSSLLDMLKIFKPNFTQANLNIISKVADIAIGGGVDSAGEKFTGINNVIKEAIDTYNNNHADEKFKYVQTKEAFDLKYSASNKLEYNKYVNTRLEELTFNKVSEDTNIDLNDLNKSAEYIGFNYFDPHPTYEGHKLILQAHKSVGLKAYAPEIVDYGLQTKINNADILENYTLNKNDSLSINSVCNNTDYEYTYSYVIKNAQNEEVKIYSNNAFIINYTDLPFANSYKIYATITAQKDGETFVVCQDKLITEFLVAEPQKYTVNFVTNYEAVLNNQIIYEDEEINEPILVRENYNLIGWYTDAEFNIKWDFNNKVTGDMTLYAKWGKLTYSVRFEYNGGFVEGQTFGEIEVLKGNKISKPTQNQTPTKNKYEFLGWFDSLESTDAFDFNTVITGDMILYAKWEKVYFDIIFNYNGGKVGSDEYLLSEGKKGDFISEPTGTSVPVLEDYELTGWYKESTCENKWDFSIDKITRETTLYAGWRRNVFYVTLNYNGAVFNGNSQRVVKVKENTKMEEPLDEKADNYKNFNKSGYIFVYWYLDDENVAFTFPADITADIELKACWKEAITIGLRNDNDNVSYLLLKGTTVAEFKNIYKPKKTGTTFLGWYKDSGLKYELVDNVVLENNQIIFAKWVSLICQNRDKLVQSFSPITKLVKWYVDAKDGSKLVWKVNGETALETEVVGDNGYTYSYAPKAVGDYKIDCEVDGVLISGDTVSISYSIPKEITVTLLKVSDKKFYYIEVDNKQYYNPDKFVWYKTEDLYSNDFNEKIGEGFELNNYKFNSDCKVCVKYLENKDSTDGLVSNIINIRVDNYVDETTLFAIIISASVVALIAIGVIVSRIKYKNFF